MTDPDRMIQVSQGTMENLTSLIQQQTKTILALEQAVTALLVRQPKPKNKVGVPRATVHKRIAQANALRSGRKVIWLDRRGLWHCATNRANTPNYAVVTEDVQ